MNANYNRVKDALKETYEMSQQVSTGTPEQKESELTTYDVAEKRLAQLSQERQDLFLEEEQLKARLKEIEMRRKEITLEERIMQTGLRYEGQIKFTERTITVHAREGYVIRNERMDLEETLRTIFNAVGRPMKLSEIIQEVAKVGHQWSTQQKARYNIMKLEILESTGAYGYYNLRRNR